MAVGSAVTVGSAVAVDEADGAGGAVADGATLGVQPASITATPSATRVPLECHRNDGFQRFLRTSKLGMTGLSEAVGVNARCSHARVGFGPDS